MPRLSLYKPEKGSDFKFLDRVINEQFQVGGTDVFVHKYMGPVLSDNTGTNTPGTASQTNTFMDELSIQDVILMENRDRHYDPNVYVMRGIYQMQDLDFNLSQFGIFLNNDNIFIHFHLRGCVDALGRKLMAGDVLELPHLKDEYAMNDSTMALKRFYVVQEVTRAAAGFSQTWYPHLLRVKCTPLVDTQEYSEILNAIQYDSNGNPAGTLSDLISTYNQNIAINDAIIAQAEADAPQSGYDTNQLYVLPQNPDGTLMVEDTSNIDVDASRDLDLENIYTNAVAPINPAVGDRWLDTSDPANPTAKWWSGTVWKGANTIDASMILKSPDHNYYLGYLTGDGRPPNGAPYTFCITFPQEGLVDGQFHLRTDYFPNRLFRYNGQHWMRFEDNVRMTLTNKPTDGKTAPNTQTRQTQRTSFINNANTATIAGKVVPERQALSQALKPKADN